MAKKRFRRNPLNPAKTPADQSKDPQTSAPPTINQTISPGNISESETISRLHEQFRSRSALIAARPRRCLFPLEGPVYTHAKAAAAAAAASLEEKEPRNRARVSGSAQGPHDNAINAARARGRTDCARVQHRLGLPVFLNI